MSAVKKAIVLDIEGTVCPISFVKETLFPYALSALPIIVQDLWSENEFKPYKDQFSSIIDEKSGKPATSSPEIFENVVRHLSSIDSKIPALKNLQGYIWAEGFSSGQIKSPIYQDSYEKIKSWHQNSIPVYIYSSGSIPAQKLLFKHTNYGDLTHFLSGYFDPATVGVKTDHNSYLKISKEISFSPENCLFFSDNINEIHAANKAGFKTYVVDRPGNAPIPKNELAQENVITTFKDI